MGLREWWARVTGAADATPGSDDDSDDVTAPPSVPTEGDILTALDRVRDLAVQGAVPAAVSSRLRRIDTSIRETLPRLRNLGLGSIDAYSVMATATDYLPEAIGGYLRLPRDWADSRPIDNGKSSLLVLIDQLDLLGATMDRIFDAVNAHDAQALIAHGRFLQEKFGTASTGGQLNLGAGADMEDT
jgi:hypothetical protein